ncbi:MAG: hypothetical protein CME70_11325 [Halobacteriovorax sp.]|nr:hypothetical protein [Halobacteriovorax sp.]|tara:strand:- start:88214 stop:88456 length:243 start_codon:yes stop_codon:yes gene_type:complete
MAEFLGDIAFMIEILVLGLGLVVIHYGKKEKSKLLKTSGYLMSIFSILALICTTFFYFKYYFNGDFDSAYPKSTFSTDNR